MFGKGFQLEVLLNTITEVKPTSIALGTHHYVQLAESDILQQTDPEELKSVKLMLPAGAAVPSSCEIRVRAKFPNLSVIAIYRFRPYFESCLICEKISGCFECLRANGMWSRHCRIHPGQSGHSDSKVKNQGAE